MADMRVEVDGAGQTDADIDALMNRLELAAQLATRDGVSLAQRAIQTELTRTSHPLGTPTPSRPGSPPSLVTGNLRRSVKQNAVRRISRGVYMGSSGPTTVYARIQELGGIAGRRHRSHLPPRPYVAPAAKVTAAQFAEVMQRRISEAIGG